MAGCLRQTDIPGNHRGEDLAGEVLAHLLGYLGGEVGAAVEHGQRHAENLQPGIHPLFYHPQGAHQITEAFQRKILALHRNQDSVRRAQAVQGQQFQGRGAVDENQVVVLLRPEQCLFQHPLPMGFPDQLHGGTCQIRGGGEYVAVVRVDDGVFQRGFVDGHVIG